MGFNLADVHGSLEANTSQTVLVAYDSDALKFSPIGEETSSKGEQGLGGPQVGDPSYAPISPDMLGDTQLVSCSRGSGSGSSAKFEDYLLVVVKKSQWATRRHG